MDEDEIRRVFADGAAERAQKPLTATEIEESFHRTARAWEAFFGLPHGSMIEAEPGLVVSRKTQLPHVDWRKLDAETR